jgi:hypothetical protein
LRVQQLLGPARGLAGDPCTIGAGGVFGATQHIFDYNTFNTFGWLYFFLFPDQPDPVPDVQSKVKYWPF